jgi:hypothetical protein
MTTMATTADEEKKTFPINAPQKGIETPSDVGSVEGIDVLLLATDEHPAHPRNWSVFKRWGVLFVLCSFQAFMYSSL